jgi:hypothetical protein
MPINFDSLPKERPNTTIPAGRYTAVIAAAEMKPNKDISKPNYLNLRLEIFDENNNKLGSIFDILTESEASLARYKLQRFITALELNIPSFELSDLPKVIIGKKFEVDLKIEQQEGYAARTVVDATTNEIYYPIVEYPFTASDSADSTPNSTTGDTSEY